MEKVGIQGTWKRLRRDGELAASVTSAMLGIGSKRKGTTPLKEVQKELENGKRCKKEDEVALMGQLMARHLGLAEAAAQPRRYQ